MLAFLAFKPDFTEPELSQLGSALSNGRSQAPCPAWAYVNRSRVERLWGRLKEWRAVATRYEKTACSFMGVLCLAATMDWIRR